MQQLEKQDLLRASIDEIGKEAIIQVFQFLNGSQDYPTPISIHFDLTMRCSARCIHCRQWTWPQRNTLSLIQLKNIITRFMQWKVKTITFGGGNPLLYKYINEALVFAREADMDIGIISEGGQLDDKLCKTISDCARWIRFSIDGHEAKIHDSIRRAPGLFNMVVKNIKDLKASNYQLAIGLNCVIQKKNIGTLPQIIQFADEVGADIIMFKIPHGNDYRGEYILSLKEWRILVDLIQELNANKTYRVKTNLNALNYMLNSVIKEKDAIEGRPVSSFYIENDTHCFAPFFFLTCDSLGDMYPCDYLQADVRDWLEYYNMRNEFCLGNILEDSDSILGRLAMMMTEQIHHMPSRGFSECGCCTRFYHINHALSLFGKRLDATTCNVQDINQFLRLDVLPGHAVSFL